MFPRDRDLLDRTILLSAECRRVVTVLRDTPPGSPSFGAGLDALAHEVDNLFRLVGRRLDAAPRFPLVEDFTDKVLWEPKVGRLPTQRLNVITTRAAALDAHARALLSVDPSPAQVVAELEDIAGRLSTLSAATYRPPAERNIPAS